MDPFTVPLTVGRMGRAASQLRPLALVFGKGVEGGGRGWFRVSRWRLKDVTFLGEKKVTRRNRVGRGSLSLARKKVTRRNRVDRGSLSEEGTSSAQHRADPSRPRSEGS